MSNVAANCRIETVSLKQAQSSQEYDTFMSKYERFTERTIEGQLGNTAKYWILYVKLVALFLQFSRACRTNCLSLFVSTLKDMCPIFFAMNRPNYARWMVRYHLNLLNMDTTHPGLRSAFEGGALSIRRSEKAFTRLPVDMALEQTVNADAASRQTGIVGFNNSESARRRWMVTRSMRSSIVGGLLEKAGLQTKDGVASTLKEKRILRDNSDVQKVVDRITTSFNPFDTASDENLYCLTTGRQCSQKVSDDLLHCFDLGEKWKTEFLNRCYKDPSSFEKAIPRRKLMNFAADSLKTKVTSKDRKIIELQGTRYLFGRLLFLGMTNNIDLQKVFQYPLVPVPLSIGQIDGSLNKTDKSSLMKKLESMSCGPAPSSIDVTFIDGCFLLHTLTNLPQSMGDMSKVVLRIICSMSKVVHFVCDTYVTPSIKCIERTRRGEDRVAYSVTGRDQKCPSNWQQALQSPEFKTAVFRFFASDWATPTYADILQGHEVYIGLDEQCYYFKEVNGVICREEKPQYHCTHEEAETRLIFHLYNTLKETNNNTKCCVRSNDTDVMILLLYHIAILGTSDVWMDAGLSRQNTRRYINIGSLSSELGMALSSALPGFHAITGCDYTGSFMNKGKLKPLQLLMKDDDYIEAFIKIGENMDIADTTMKAIEGFVCKLYGKSKYTDVYEARLSQFHDKYSFKTLSGKSPLSEIKGLNPSCMSPCRKVLEEKIRRANYVACLWKNAHLASPINESPESHGWIAQTNGFEIDWYKGDQLPSSIVDLLVTNPNDVNDEDNEWESQQDDDGDSGTSDEED